jgi:class 3 adenylate cyclase
VAIEGKGSGHVVDHDLDDIESGSHAGTVRRRAVVVLVDSDASNAGRRRRRYDRPVPRLHFKLFSQPDDIRSMSRAEARIVELDEVSVGLARWEPGWRWSTDLRPVAGTESCEFHHLGYAVSGSLHVAMDDGQSIEIPPGAVYEIPPGHDAWVLGSEPFVTVEWRSARTVGVAAEGERVLATVLFTDIVGSTARLQEIGDAAWRDLLIGHNTSLRREISAFRGRELATTGDGFLVVFDSATRAVRCAAAMRRSAAELGITIRAGIHTGEVEFVGTDARGVAVHAAARVIGLAGPGEIVVSSTTRDLLEGSGLALEETGAHELKGLSGLRTVYRLASGGAADRR